MIINKNIHSLRVKYTDKNQHYNKPFKIRAYAHVERQKAHTNIMAYIEPYQTYTLTNIQQNT